jgi:hypothetical protein
VLAGAPVLAACAAVAAVLVIHHSGSSQGPLVADYDGAEGIGWPLNLGQRGSVSGGMLIHNRGDRSVALDRVEEVGAINGGPDIIGVYATPYVRRNGRALPGAVVQPHERLEIVIGVRATQLGRHGFGSLNLVYHDGGTSYRTTLPIGLAICAPMSTRCRDPLADG